MYQLNVLCTNYVLCTNWMYYVPTINTILGLNQQFKRVYIRLFASHCTVASTFRVVFPFARTIEVRRRNIEDDPSLYDIVSIMRKGKSVCNFVYIQTPSKPLLDRYPGPLVDLVTRTSGRLGTVGPL